MRPAECLRRPGPQDFNSTGVLVRPAPGSCVVYDGSLYHSANPIRWGERAIAVFFFHSFLGVGAGEKLDYDRARGEVPAGIDAVEVQLPAGPHGRGRGGGAAAISAALLEAGFTTGEDTGEERTATSTSSDERHDRVEL